MFSALAFGQREVLGMAGSLWRIDLPLSSAPLEHQGVNISLVLFADRLHVPMHGPILEESGTRS